MNPPWVGSGCRVSNTADGSESTGIANSPTRFRLSEVRKVIASRLEGSSVEDVISIKEVVLEMPSSRRCESAVWFPLPESNPMQRCGSVLLKLQGCSVGKPSFCLAPHFDQKLFELSTRRHA